jgi:hypothetical protein
LESLSSVYEDVYVVVKRSICYSSLVLQKEKGLSDLKFREEICLSVCVSVEALFCEDESQKDFERETRIYTRYYSSRDNTINNTTHAHKNNNENFSIITSSI